MDKEIQYITLLVTKDIAEVLIIISFVIVLMALAYYADSFIAKYKKVLKFRKGYDRALSDAINELEFMFNEFNADEMVADIPTQKRIIEKLEVLKNGYKRSIQDDNGISRVCEQVQESVPEQEQNTESDIAGTDNN